MTDEVERIKLAGQIDISCVQAFHTLKEIDEMIEIAKKYGFAAVFTLPAFSAHVAERLRDCKEIHTGGVVSFPGGGDTIEQKKRQAKELWETGCEEVDMVMNLTALKPGVFLYKGRTDRCEGSYSDGHSQSNHRSAASDGSGDPPGSGTVHRSQSGLCEDQHRLVSGISFHRGAGTDHE